MAYPVPATSDVFFKYLFGSESNTRLLCSFINTIQVDSGFSPIVSVTLKNPFNIKKFAIDKETVLDVKAADDHGRLYDIEMQSTPTRQFVNRSLYYWARLYSEQLGVGTNYRRLLPVICINVLGSDFFDELVRPHSCFLLTEKDNPGYTLTDHCTIHYLEIQKLTGTPKTKIDKWAYFFAHAHEKGDPTMKILLKDEDINQAYGEYQKFNRSSELLELNESRRKYQLDHNTAIEDAREEGLEKGLEQGIEEGIEQGKIETAEKMVLKGMSNADIRDITGLSIKKIQELRGRKKK